MSVANGTNTMYGRNNFKTVKKVLCIGPCSNLSKNKFTGQSVMFDGVSKHFAQKGLEVVIVDISPMIGGSRTLFRVIDYLLIISHLLLKLIMHHFDVTYITTSQSRNGFLRDYIMINLCHLFKISIIAHQYGANYLQLTDKLDDKGLNRLKTMLGYTDYILVEGDYMKDQFSFLSDYHSKVIVVPNGLPFEGENVGIAKVYDGRTPFVLFYLSNMIWSKGFFDVLKAIDILVNKERLNVKCVFAGQFMKSVDDEDSIIENKEDFQKYVEDFNLASRIIYYPGLFGDEKDRCFSGTNAFLLPTYYINEGQPISIIEAMAYGCVPIVTKYRHIPMMVNDKNGCFVEAKNPLEIATAVKYLINHPDIYEYKSRQCIYDYQQKFKFNVFADKIMECVNTVLYQNAK